jgi:CRISPR-associated protein Cas5t
VERFWLHVRAPFAAYRAMQAGVYRTTLPVVPHSAAYGLVMNLAAIETRDPTPAPTTLMRGDVPRIRLAVGACGAAEVSTLYQQLHGYPVGSSGKELKARTHGAKYWIAPVRRELLVGLDMVIGVDADADLRERVRRGLAGDLPGERYGLPFAGDNNLLFDRIDLLDTAPAARWYARLSADDAPRRGSCRLTVGIDRADSSRTTSVLCAPTAESTTEPPESAWVWTPRAHDE